MRDRGHGPRAAIRDRGKLASDEAYLSDRYSPGNRHPGTNSILRLPGAELVKEGVRAGDLLAATEASARTIVVRCGHHCTVRYVAIGPAISHAEGHIAFTSPAGKPQPSQTAAVADWPCSAGPSSCLLRAADPPAARTERQAM